jgi:hypothetical protein
MINRNQAKLESTNGEHLKRISISEAYSMADAGEAEILTSNRDIAQGKILRVRLKQARRSHASLRSHTSLTQGDCVANAEARDEDRTNRARIRVDRWPEVHDRRAVTIHAGKVWIPDQKAGAKRASELAVAARRG